MTENEWTELINDKLSAFLKKGKLRAKTLQKIPYSFEIDDYTEDWQPDIDKESIMPFETDLGFVQPGNIHDGLGMKDGHYENICPYYYTL